MEISEMTFYQQVCYLEEDKIQKVNTLEEAQQLLRKAKENHNG